jgi:hypothetical protein
MMDEVDDQALDVGAVLILAGHDHHLAIPQAFDVVHGLVLLLVLQPHNLDQIRYLLVR